MVSAASSSLCPPCHGIGVWWIGVWWQASWWHHLALVRKTMRKKRAEPITEMVVLGTDSEYGQHFLSGSPGHRTCMGVAVLPSHASPLV